MNLRDLISLLESFGKVLTSIAIEKNELQRIENTLKFIKYLRSVIPAFEGNINPLKEGDKIIILDYSYSLAIVDNDLNYSSGCQDRSNKIQPPNATVVFSDNLSLPINKISKNPITPDTVIRRDSDSRIIFAPHRFLQKVEE